MAETTSESLTLEEKRYLDLARIRSEALCCTLCKRYFSRRTEFIHHQEHHITTFNSCRFTYVNTIENNICNKCNKAFEVKSDLMIHYNTVCLDGPYTCRHCRENCETFPFLHMHLIVHHNYTEDDLRRKGYLSHDDPNPFDNFPESDNNPSFIKSIRRKAFKSPSPDVVNADYSAENVALAKASCTTRKSRRKGNKNGNLAFNLLDKVYACKICNKSFSRKCVLEIHVQNHTLKKIRKKRFVRDISANSLFANSSENNCVPTTNTMQEFIKRNVSEVTAKYSDNQRAILKPSNVVLGSSVWKKVQPERRFQGIKACSTVSVQQRKEDGISEVTLHQSQPCECVSKKVPPKRRFKGINKHITKPKHPKTNISMPSDSVFKNTLPMPSRFQGIKTYSTEGTKQRNKDCDFAVTVDQSTGTNVSSQQSNANAGPSSWMRINLKSKHKIKRKPKNQEKSNASELSRSKKTKGKKEMPKNDAKQVFICKLCKGRFKDNYKLNRHALIHTGERPYECTKCKKTFARDDHLKRHIKKVCSKTAISA